MAFNFMAVEITNGFVEEVITPSQDMLIELAQVNSDIAEEQSLWQKSSAAADIATRLRSFFERLGMVGRTVSFPPEEEHVKKEWMVLFGNNTNPKATSVVSNKIMSQLPAAAKQDLREIDQMKGDYISDYHEATRDLRERHQELTTDFNGQTINYLKTRYLNPREFSLFLSEEQFTHLRETSQPCLEAFAKMVDTETKRGRDPLESIKRQLVEAELSSPSPEIISHVRQHALSGNGASSSKAWIELLIHLNPGLTSEVLADALTKVFPQDLKTAIRTLLEIELKQSIMDLRKMLSPYRPVDTLAYRIDVKVPSRRNLRNGNYTTSIDIQTREETVAPQKPQHRFILNGDTNPNADQLRAYIRKEFPKVGPEVQDDFVKMLSALSDDPFRLGSGTKLRSCPPLRRYKPIGLPLTSEISKKHRVIYYIGDPLDPSARNLGRNIHFVELIHHDEMDARYS